MTTSKFKVFWGKARGTRGNGPPWHPLWMHSLDVAAVGRASGPATGIIHHLSRSLDWPVDKLRDVWVFLLALHDIGKFSEHFQAKVDEFWPVDVFGRRAAVRLGSDPGHGAAADSLIFERRRGFGPFETRRNTWFPGWDYESDSVRTLFAPVLGHHGRPVSAGRSLLGDLFREPAEGAALAFADAMHALLEPPVLPEPKAPVLRRATWPLAGLTTIADWVGSNRDWFPYRENGPTFQDYWNEIAGPQARDALAQAGLVPARPARAAGFRALTDIEHPSPVQVWAESVPLPDGPLLMLIEDMTGGGKTEAAIMLAHRLMAAEERADGIYFALPTRPRTRCSIAWRRSLNDSMKPAHRRP